MQLSYQLHWLSWSVGVSWIAVQEYNSFWVYLGPLHLCLYWKSPARAADLETDDGWLCGCGWYQGDDFHCERCGEEPPWGCACDMHGYETGAKDGKEG